MLNVSKGPAVHSLRAQADKAEYSRAMRKVLENQDHLTIKQAEVCEILWEYKSKNDESANDEAIDKGPVSNHLNKNTDEVKKHTVKCKRIT